jgi:hypothetical protein
MPRTLPAAGYTTARVPACGAGPEGRAGEGTLGSLGDGVRPTLRDVRSGARDSLRDGDRVRCLRSVVGAAER